jgi:enoyl-CoA hydratase/carnithine racemase
MDQARLLFVEKQPPLAWLKLNRPEKANALNSELLRALSAACENLANDHKIHAVAVIGAGSKAFCAGADLEERKTMSDSEVVAYHTLIGSTFMALERLPQPVVAVLNGPAYGGGAELALACDLRVLVSDAFFRLTETRLGIIPGAGGTQRLPRLVGVSRAKEIIFFSKALDAREAKDCGLVHLVIDKSRAEFDQEQNCFNQHLITQVNAWLGEMLRAAPLSLRQAKIAIDSGCDQDLEAGLALESKAYMQLLSTRDRREALQAFAEKRSPVFTGS